MKLYCSFFIPTREKKSTWNLCMGWKKCGKKLVLFNLFKMTKITLPKKKKKKWAHESRMSLSHSHHHIKRSKKTIPQSRPQA